MTGWWTLADFYGFEGDHTILFCYIGENVFHITVYMEDVREIYFNRYLDEVEGRKPLTIGPFHHFSINLSPLDINTSSLVSLSLIFLKWLLYCIPFVYLLFWCYWRVYLLHFLNIFAKVDSKRLRCMDYWRMLNARF